MDNRLALSAAELAGLLQEVHFAARALEERVKPDPSERIVDRIHAARLLVERLRCALSVPPL
jgi:hypothetical protein